ncbi:alpha/beta-hydrolase [Auriscalpium vulgare]|uniref:Alpha/beta-hydrolase n=1 Tax=Auriscalpium vulgare TaxID=40419 RepID=A0ACB8S510_9AGAM|nr:alpha/beta-hydrolase [Auriscalpium vulgare]
MLLHDKGLRLVAVLSFWSLLFSPLAAAAPSANASSTAATSGKSSGSSTPSTTAPASSSSSPSANATSSAASASSSASVPFPIAPPLKPGQLPNSFPSNPNVTDPNANFSSEWQDDFRVTLGLPNITFPLSGNFAGNLPNGPMLLHPDLSISQNPKSLTNMLDIFWIDQPVGSGYSTADSDGYAKDEDDVAADFLGFLTNLVKVFPSLSTRPLFLAGEDYAGVFIPYIAQALLAAPSPPVVLKKIAIGNGPFSGFSVGPHLGTVSILESFPQLIKFDQNVFQAFQSKSHLCDFDVNVTYPQENALPSFPPQPKLSSIWSTVSGKQAEVVGLLDRRAPPTAKRQSASVSNTLDPFYGCSLFDEMVDYAANFSFPWTPGTFDMYDVPNVVQPPVVIDGEVYFNSQQVRTGLHAPFSKNWTSVSAYPFGSTTNFCTAPFRCAPATFFNDLISSASAKGVEIVLYAGSNNAVANHHTLELLIQNATFGGTRGFTRKPATPWQDDNAQTAGVVHQERGLLYALFDNVGGLTPFSAPNAAYVFYRDFVVNANATGSLTTTSSNKPAVLGGEDAARADDQPRVASALTLAQSTVLAPPATLAAWESFLATAAPAGPTSAATSGAAAGARARGWGVLLGVLGVYMWAW